MNPILSISYHNDAICEKAYQQLYDTMIDEKTEVWVLDNHYPLKKNPNLVQDMCAKFGFKYFDAGENLGLHEGYNYLVKQLPADCTCFIVYDGDSFPLTPNWHIPLFKVHENSKVVWASLHNVHSYREMDERGFTPATIFGYNARITLRPVVNSISSFKRKWIHVVEGFSEPHKYYGGLEMSMWFKKPPGTYWIFLNDFTEGPIGDINDPIYTAYKIEHAHKGNPISFDEFLKQQNHVN